MASFDDTVSINASPESVWLAVQNVAAQEGEVTAEMEGRLLVIRRLNNNSLVYFLQGQGDSRLVNLRHVVTIDADAGATLRITTDIPTALDTLPGGSAETDSLEAWPARRRLDDIISAAEGRARITYVERASLVRRFLAYAIDLIILSFVNGLISSLSSRVQAQEWWSAAWGIIGVAIPAIYFVWPYSTSGETLGKRALGIKVVSIDGSPLNWRKGILRSVGYIFSTIPLGLGFLWAIWDADKQAGHDKIAGTCVVSVSVAPEQLRGNIEPSEVRRRRTRWLLGLGIPTLLIAGGLFFLIWQGVAEVSAMGPWPGSEIPPKDLVTVDLSHLGLEAGQMQSARDQETWVGGSYEEGILITYESGTNSVVFVWALRYETTQAASNDYHFVIAAAEGFCGLTASASLGNTGMILCQFGNGYQKLFWNDYWIINIVAQEGAELTPDVLVNQVRDAIAAHWRTIIVPS